MFNHKSILEIEMIVILIPVSILAMLGGGAIILLQISEKIWQAPLVSLLYLSLTILLLASLFSLWMIVLYFTDDMPLHYKPSVIILRLTDSGAFFSFLCLIAVIVESNSPPPFNQIAETIVVFSVASPALLPYLHTKYLRKTRE